MLTTRQCILEEFLKNNESHYEGRLKQWSPNWHQGPFLQKLNGLQINILHQMGQNLQLPFCHSFPYSIKQLNHWVSTWLNLTVTLSQPFNHPGKNAIMYWTKDMETKIPGRNLKISGEIQIQDKVLLTEHKYSEHKTLMKLCHINSQGHTLFMFFNLIVFISLSMTDSWRVSWADICT